MAETVAGNVNYRIYWIEERELRAYEERPFQQEIDSLPKWGLHQFIDPIRRVPPTGYLSHLSFRLLICTCQREVKGGKESRSHYV